MQHFRPEILHRGIQRRIRHRVKLRIGDEVRLIAPAQHRLLIFGQDVGGVRNGTLFLLFNTLIAGDGRIRFVRLSSPGARLAAIGNEFSGSGRIAERVGAGGPITSEGNFGAGNLVDTKADAPENWLDTRRVRNGSVSRKPVYIDADGIERDGIPVFFPPPDTKEGGLPASLAPRGENNRAPGAG